MGNSAAIFTLALHFCEAYLAFYNNGSHISSAILTHTGQVVCRLADCDICQRMYCTDEVVCEYSTYTPEELFAFVTLFIVRFTFHCGQCIILF